MVVKEESEYGLGKAGNGKGVPHCTWSVLFKRGRPDLSERVTEYCDEAHFVCLVAVVAFSRAHLGHPKDCYTTRHHFSCFFTDLTCAKDSIVPLPVI